MPSSPDGLSFHLLGRLEAYRDGVEVDLGPRKQRAVLALLLLNANRVVSTERLIDDLWGDFPPSTARAALQVYVAGLRKAQLVKTGDRTFCFVGEWDSMDAIAAARPAMIGMLDTFRPMLEDLGGGLGLTDPVSGTVVADIKP